MTAGGIIPTACTGTDPCTECQTFGQIPFGQCWKPEAQGGDVPIAVTLDALPYLPAPTPGRVLERRCLRSPNCDCDEMYYMFRTGCFDHTVSGGRHDYSPQCSEGLAGYTSHVYRAYLHTHNSTCGGESTPPKTIGRMCTQLGGRTPGHGIGVSSVWCGEACPIWKTLRATWPKCDAVDAGTQWSVDLSTKSALTSWDPRSNPAPHPLFLQARPCKCVPASASQLTPRNVQP